MTSAADCRLRPLAEPDRDRTLAWRNSDRVRVNMYTDHLIAADEHARWFAAALAATTARHLIFECAGRALGLVSFTNIDARHERCTWAFYLGETDVPRGTGSVMEFLALDHAFDRIGVRKLCCEVFAFNAGVVRLHEKFGFEREGCLRGHYRKHERFEDVVVLARFADGWRADRDRLRAVVFRDSGGKTE